LLKNTKNRIKERQTKKAGVFESIMQQKCVKLGLAVSVSTLPINHCFMTRHISFFWTNSDEMFIKRQTRM